MEWYQFKGLYLAVDLAVLALPLLLSFDKNVQFYKHWKHFFLTNLGVGGFFILWDALFSEMGVWAFNPDYLLGPELLGLPLEEWLFFFCIPYASVFTYFSLKHYVKRNPLIHADTTLNFAAILTCAGLIIAYFPRYYIALTSFYALVWLVWATRNSKSFMADLWLAYFVLLAPFIISNGVLTGLSFWEFPLLHHSAENILDQIVWYHPGHNTGWRIFTMPVDDLVYGFLLIAMHVAGMERLITRDQRKAALSQAKTA